MKLSLESLKHEIEKLKKNAAKQCSKDNFP